MPISRALLNRLRLPYKALEIQGSKGDVLYIPDDVGVDLSVIHGVHNGDMVPVKTDNNGVISVGVDVGNETNKGKHQFVVADGLTIDTSVSTLHVDTSKTANYVIYFRIVTSTNNSLTFHASVLSIIRDLEYNTLATINIQSSVDNNIRQFLIANTATTTTNDTRLDCQITGGSGSVTVDIDMIGWN